MRLSGAETYLFLWKWSVRAGKQKGVCNFCWYQETRIPLFSFYWRPTNWKKKKKSQVILSSVGLFPWNSRHSRDFSFYAQKNQIWSIVIHPLSLPLPFFMVCHQHTTYPLYINSTHCAVVPAHSLSRSSVQHSNTIPWLSLLSKDAPGLEFTSAWRLLDERVAELQSAADFEPKFPGALVGQNFHPSLHLWTNSRNQPQVCSCQQCYHFKHMLQLHTLCMCGCWQLSFEGSFDMFSPTDPAADPLSWAAIAPGWILPMEAAVQHPSPPHHTLHTQP